MIKFYSLIYHTVISLLTKFITSLCNDIKFNKHITCQTFEGKVTILIKSIQKYFHHIKLNFDHVLEIVTNTLLLRNV
jgi:hypothetical protein